MPPDIMHVIFTYLPGFQIASELPLVCKFFKGIARGFTVDSLNIIASARRPRSCHGWMSRLRGSKSLVFTVKREEGLNSRQVSASMVGSVAAWGCLASLTLSKCDFMGVSIALPKSVEKVSFRSCSNLFDADLSPFETLPKLKDLLIKDCILSQTQLLMIARLGIEKLCLESFEQIGLGTKWILGLENAPNLRELTISSFRVGESEFPAVDFEVFGWKGAKVLEHLDFTKVLVYGRVSVLAGFQNLTSLSLSHDFDNETDIAEFTDDDIAVLGQLRKLESIEWSASKGFFGHGFSTWDSGSLKVALLGCTDLETVEHLPRSLEALDIFATNIDSTGISRIGEFTSLRDLDLSVCCATPGVLELLPQSIRCLTITEWSSDTWSSLENGSIDALYRLERLERLVLPEECSGYGHLQPNVLNDFISHQVKKNRCFDVSFANDFFNYM